MTAALESWIPIRFGWHEGRAMVDWCRLDRGFSEPFFDETISACLQRPFNLLFRRSTPIETLLEWQERSPGLPPSGFIFHMSRCGSTMAARMLAAMPRNLVLSEADPIDGVLKASWRNPDVSTDDRRKWLRGIVRVLGQRRNGDEERLFIKFESWHILELPLIRSAFPGVPWIFLYRDPIEVLVSQERLRGQTMKPGPLAPRFLGVDEETAARMRPEEYTSRVLARLCQAALEHQPDGGMLVHYRELPEAVAASFADCFGSPVAPAEAERMHEVARFDAKKPQLLFAADSSEKQRRASDSIREAAALFLEPVYRRLEERRTSTGRSGRN
jgi:hypothetical protein